MDSKKNRVFYLDFIRAIAMLLVIFYHFNVHFETFNISGFNKIFNEFNTGDWGAIGVTLFFIISGSSLIYNYSNKIDYKDYAKKRFKNIFPMFWIAYIVAFLYTFYKNIGINNDIPKYKLILSFLGIDGYYLYLSPNFYQIGEWFLGAIIILYFIFPMIRYIIKKNDKLALSFFIILGICNFYILTNNPFEITENRNILVCLFSFCIGIYYIEYIKEIKWYQALIALFLFIMLRITKLNMPKYLISNIAGYLLFIVLIYISKYINGIKIKKIFKSLSKYSYSIFLVHHIIIIHLEQRFSNRILGKFEVMCLFILTFICILFFARLLYDVTKKISDKFGCNVKLLENKKGE